MTSMMAQITWVKYKDGGRKSIPVGRYSTVAEFPDRDKGFGCWSLVLDLATQSNKQRRARTQFALVLPLVTWAPKNLLHKGGTFKLYEGSKLVAHGLCLHEPMVVSRESENQ